MRVVGRAVERVARARGGEVALVGGDGLDVGAQRVAVEADAVVDVRRHVHDVARRRHQRGEAARVRQRALGPHRGFHRVDVEVDRAGVRRVAREHRLERAHDVGAAALGLRAGGLPVVPRLGVHHRLGVQRQHRVVGREARGDLLHGVGVGGVERGAVGGRVGGVARRQRVDQRALLRRRPLPQRLRALQRVERGRVGLRHHRHVDVGPEDERLAPVAHGAAGVDRLRGAEGALRLGVVEAERQPQPLVEVGLRARAGGADADAEHAEPAVERHLAAGGLHRLRLERRRLGFRQQQRGEQRRPARPRRRAQAAGARQQRVVGTGRHAPGADGRRPGREGGEDAAGRHRGGGAAQRGTRIGCHEPSSRRPRAGRGRRSVPILEGRPGTPRSCHLRDTETSAAAAST